MLFDFKLELLLELLSLLSLLFNELSMLDESSFAFFLFKFKSFVFVINLSISLFIFKGALFI